MKIIMLNGSPRLKSSTSLYLLEALKEKMSPGTDILLYEASRQSQPPIAQTLAGRMADCDCLVVAFPLYVDGIPGSLLEVLSAIQTLLPPGEKSTKVYVLVNCGFYEAVQTDLSIRIFWKWCEKCGLKKGRAVGVGAGPMMQLAPMGHGPAANLGKMLDTLSADILSQATADTVYTEPNFPRFLYKLAAHMGWRSAARKNKVKLSDVKHLV